MAQRYDITCGVPWVDLVLNASILMTTFEACLF
jgi:hypothetical protein